MQSLGVRSVDLCRGPGGFGFTLSSQGPCVLSCILASSPAHKAGLRPGDQILYVNGSSVEKFPHEQVVKLIARSPNGVVNLGVRHRADSADDLTTKKSSNNGTETENVDNENILNSVDKVVEELKSGHLTLHKQPPLRYGSHEQATCITEDEIVSDEELRASFTETLRSESSCESVFIDQNHCIDDRRASEGDGLPGLSVHKRLHYPVLSPPNNSTTGSEAKSEADLTAVVGYLGSIELPGNSSLQTASLNAIRSCVRRLRAQQKVHVIFLLEVSDLGIRLIDNNGKTIVTYPAKSLAFTGVCADDKRVFGVVTKKVNEALRPNSWHTNDNMDSSAATTVTSSCHVFTVDPEISLHNNHANIAERFHIECKPVNDKCKQFLESSSPILQAIDDLFIEKTDSVLFNEKSESLHSHSSVQSKEHDVGNNMNIDLSNQDIDVESCDENVLEKEEVPLNRRESHVNECVMETPKHKIHVRVTDCPDSIPNSQWPSVEEEPFRHRVVQIERIQTPFIKRDESALEESQAASENDIFVAKENSETKESHDILEYCIENDKTVEITQTAIPATELNGGSPDSQTSANSNAGESADSRLSNSHFFVNPKKRLSHSAENLAHTDYETVVSGNSNLNLSPSVCSSTHSIHSISSLPGDVSNINGRVARWALGFDKLMEDPSGLKCFQEFLKKEFSEENIVFWVACEEFRNLTTEKELKAEAVNIFDAHLSTNATMPVNIDSSAVKLAEENLANPTNDMYRLQQHQVYTLMKFDSYPRFLKSDVYRQCLVADMEGLPLPYEEEKLDKGKIFKKGNGLSLSSEDSECSSLSSRGSYTFEIKQRSTRGWGRRSSKKSSSSYDEPKTPSEKKRSFLPWKGKQPKNKAVNRPFDSQPSSARSSLSSLSDSFPSMSYSTESLEGRRESDAFQFCRVVLPDHSSTIITVKQGQTLRQALTQLCDRRHMSFIATEVFIGGSDRPVQDKQLDADMVSMAGKEINLEHRSLFRVELSRGMSYLVKARPDQSIRESIEPILARFNMEYSNVILHLVDCEVPLDSGIPVASIEHQYVVIETNDQLNGNNNGPPKINIKPPAGFSSPRRSSRRGSSIDDSIFDDIIRGKKQSLGNGYFDDAGVWVPGLKPFRSQESLNDDSFGRSFLRGPGLFSKKRKESNDKEKSLNKSGRYQGQSNTKNNTEVTELLDLLTRAQGKRMDDQRGELGKHSFELPDFLRIPDNTHAPSRETQMSPAPIPPPPPPVPELPLHTTGSLKLRGETRPVVRKTQSTPAGGGDLMSELADRLRRRSTSENMSIPEVEVSEDSAGSAVKPRDASPWEPRVERYRRINTVRPRTTDGAVFKVEAVTPVRLDRPMSPTGVTMLHSESMPDTLQSRTRSTQPLTVNSIRGFPTSTGNISNRIDESTEKNVRVVQAVQVHKYNPKHRTLSSSSVPEYSTNIPYICEATPTEDREKTRPSIKRRQSDGVTTSSGKGNLSPFHIPHINSRKTEVFVPSTPGIKPYRIVSSESKPRPKPITNSAELMAGLEEDSSIPPIVPPPPPCDLIPTSLVSSKASSSDRNSTSPLPLPPSPVHDHLGEIEMANFPPPTPLTNFKGKVNEGTPLTSDDINKTITPGTCERTFVEEPSDEGTPYGTHKNTNRNNRKPVSLPFDDSWTSVGGTEIPKKLDPYVTYESEDMRITFV